MSPARRPLFTCGLRGARVNAFGQTLPSGAKVLTVEWREPGRKSRSWPLTTEGRRLAKAFAEGTAQRLASRGAASAPRLTLRQLFDRYLTAHDHTWRPTTKTGNVARFRVVANIVGEHEFADLLTPETLDDVRQRLRTTKRAKTGQPMAPNQIRETLARVCGLYRWAARRKLIPVNPLADYENTLGKDEGKMEVPEYTPEEFGQIIAHLSPDNPRTWRAFGVIALAGLTGKRERALLTLEWKAIDREALVIRWPKTSDKTGKRWVQPMNDETVALLDVLWAWREQIGYAGPYVFPPANANNQRGHYTADSVIKALHAAERRAGVRTVKYRALHSIKRYVVRSLYDLLGRDLMRVGRFVGNTSAKVLEASYLRERPEELEPAAEALRLPRTIAESITRMANERQTTSEPTKNPSPKSL